MDVFDESRASRRTRALALALLLAPFPASSQTLIGKTAVRVASEETSYFVQLAPAIADERITATAHALAREYVARIRLINLRGFQAEMTAESARALTWDARVTMVARYSRSLEQAPAAKFVGAARHGEQRYRVRLADSGRRYDQSRVAEIGVVLAAQYKATMTGAFVPSIGRPWVLLKATPPMARDLSRDKRVAWVAEEGTPAAAVTPDVTLEPLHRGAKPPPSHAKGPPEPARGSLQRARCHYRDYYFVALDEGRIDVTSAVAVGLAADEIAAATGMKRTAGEYLRYPQGFRLMGSAADAGAIVADLRVKWVVEVGSFLRSTDPVPGAYQVALRRSLFGSSSGRGTVRKVAEELVDEYGGRLDSRFISYAGLVGLALEDASDDSAIALSEDPRVDFVAERPKTDGHRLE
jgi:hypothetical protein